ncbi:hypothetical protein BC834DRAFT_479553 [Gloeopeniophorella convolvens]|nr:hypothetical protein BC834DRAFT_479553 [Gloeopeniophorella convolvens]
MTSMTLKHKDTHLAAAPSCSQSPIMSAPPLLHPPAWVDPPTLACLPTCARALALLLALPLALCRLISPPLSRSLSLLAACVLAPLHHPPPCCLRAALCRSLAVPRDAGTAPRSEGIPCTDSITTPIPSEPHVACLGPARLYECSPSRLIPARVVPAMRTPSELRAHRPCPG